MPHRVVRQPNGLLAVFSSIVDDLTLVNATEDEAVAYCQTYLHLSFEAAAVKVRNGVDDMDMPAPFNLLGPCDGLRRWRDAMGDVRLRHGDQIFMERMRECSTIVEARS